MTLKLEPGMRVRCVDDSPWGSRLIDGEEYTVGQAWGSYVKIEGVTGTFFASRFKPVVRVKAKSTYEGKALQSLINRAMAAVNAIAPEEYRAMQRKSWARGERVLSKLERGTTELAVSRLERKTGLGQP